MRADWERFRKKEAKALAFRTADGRAVWQVFYLYLDNNSPVPVTTIHCSEVPYRVSEPNGSHYPGEPLAVRFALVTVGSQADVGRLE